MIKSYLKIAWRNLLKDRQFTFLNLVGLSTGLACTFLIYMWIQDEKMVDRYNVKDELLYQVRVNARSDDGIRTMTSTPGLLGASLAKEIPEIEYSVSVLPESWFPYKGVVSNGETRIKAGGHYVSKDYFNAFTIDYTQGEKSRLFTDKTSVAISEELANKLFGSGQNVIGHTIKWDEQEFSGNYIVSGVFKKLPASASDQFDLIFNYDLVLEKRPNLLNWGNSDPSTYVVVKRGSDIKAVNSKIKDFLKSRISESGSTLFLTRFSENYLYGKYENGVRTGGRIAYVKMFTIIAIFILIIACINFMNLSTAKASRRIKEVGIKKVMGASRGLLVIQYIGESMLMTFVSLLFSGLLVLLLLPLFNELTGKQFVLHFDAAILLSVLGITIITGLLAGSYPAFYLSGFNPVSVLKGKFNISMGELWIRKGLIVFQFTLSVIFIGAVLIVYRQLDYIQSKNLGYNRENVIHFGIPLEMDSAKLSAAASFINELKNIPGVVNASSYYHNLTGEHGAISHFEWPGKNPNMDVEFANLEVGYNFLETVGIKLLEGRNFSPNANASNEIVFNESAIKAMGLKDPIGKTIKFWGMERQIVGVAADFNFESLYNTVKPCFFQEYPVMPNIMIRIKGGTETQSIEKIKNLFSQYYGGMIFDYQFLDEDYQQLYASEKRVGVLSRCFAGLAILISCLGLFGLAAFTAQRRQKEIGIRKVVGASVSDVTFLLSKEFLKLIIVAILIAFPVVWMLMKNWLNDFSYRITIGVDIFIITGLAIIFITIFTVSYQSIKAALANPVESLRSE